MKKIAIFASIAALTVTLCGCAGGIDVSGDNGLHVGAGVSTPVGAFGGGVTVGGNKLIDAGAGIDTPIGSAGAHAGVGGHSLVGAGAHVDTPIGGAGVDGKVMSRRGIISGKGYVEPAGDFSDD